MKVLEVGLPPEPVFVGCGHQSAVDTAVVEVRCMFQRSRPILCWKGGILEECACSHHEGVIPLLGPAFL